MSKFEKFMNILMNILGVLFGLEAIGIWFGYIVPTPLAVGFTYLFIAIFFLLAKYSRLKSK